MPTEYIDEVKKEIQDFLLISAHPNLADCMDDIPEKFQIAIFNMICNHYRLRTQKTIISFHVAEDVAAILEGKPDKAEFSKPFLEKR